MADDKVYSIEYESIRDFRYQYQKNIEIYKMKDFEARDSAWRTIQHNRRFSYEKR